jgi:hypothetical protein
MAAAMEPWPDATTIDTGRGGTEGTADESGPFGELVQEALGIVRPYGSGMSGARPGRSCFPG